MRFHHSEHSGKTPTVELKTYAAQETYLIGQKAAQLAAIDLREGLASDGGALRIGLIASPRVGKSTFCAGFMGNCINPEKTKPSDGVTLIFEKTAYKEEFSERTKNQSLSHSNKNGLVRHYDAALSLSENHALPAYADPQIRERIAGSQIVDLVEHPSNDKHDSTYDIIIRLVPRRPVEWLDDKKAPRETTIEFYCTDKIAQNPFFQDLIKECTACIQPSKEKPANNQALVL